MAELAEGTTPSGCPVDQEDVSPTVGSNCASPMKTKSEYGFEDKWSSHCPVKAESGFNSHRGRQTENKRERGVTASIADFRSVDEGSIPFAPANYKWGRGVMVSTRGRGPCSRGSNPLVPFDNVLLKTICLVV